MTTTHTRESLAATVTRWAITRIGSMICCGRLTRVVTDYGGAALCAVALHAQSC